MNTVKPFILTRRMEEILKIIHFYRYMTALDVTYLLYSPSSRAFVRKILAPLAGGADFKPNQYLYRFKLPHTSTGNTERVYTLGHRGRDFLVSQGIPVDWHFQPFKAKNLSYNQIVHDLVLTRFCVA